jgi:dihydroorotate dehydrogenase electron transfer subunit
VSVISNAEVMPRVHLLWLEAPEIAMAARPGQFVMVRCGSSHDPLLRRPLSIHRVAEARRIALLFAVAGRGTGWLSRRREGDLVDLLGPLGNGFSVQQTSRNLLLVAGGIGIAPLILLTEDALNAGHSVTLLLGAQSASVLYPGFLLPPKARLVIATEDGSEGRRGTAIDAIDDCADQADQVFACGPVSMYRSMAAKECLMRKRVQVSLEMMMGCGLGACYGCATRTRKGISMVCHDGPVFELCDVIW